MRKVEVARFLKHSRDIWAYLDNEFSEFKCNYTYREHDGIMTSDKNMMYI